MALDLAAVARHSRSMLLDHVIPFWFRSGVDQELGGVLSCMTEDGQRVNTDKYLWSQGRWLWVCSALYNRIDPRPEFLEAARKTAEFLLRHGRDSAGRWYFAVTREGVPLIGPTSIFSDCFAIYGLGEYARASGSQEAHDTAHASFERVCRRVEEPDFAETAPTPAAPGRRLHSVPMILLELANELGLQASAGEYARRILDHHVDPDRQVLLEYLNWDYSQLPAGEGTAVEPGHAIESMWFVLHWAMRSGRTAEIHRAAEVIRWHLEKGWDPEFGGLFLAIDAGGGTPYIPNADKKLWWPHTEALYACILTYKLKGEAWCEEWYRRVYQWSMQHFAMGPGLDWRQRLDRKGHPISDLVALPVKDPFHLPRALLLTAKIEF